MAVTGENTQYRDQALKVGELWVGNVRLTAEDLAALLRPAAEKPAAAKAAAKKA